MQVFDLSTLNWMPMVCSTALAPVGDFKEHETRLCLLGASNTNTCTTISKQLQYLIEY